MKKDKERVLQGALRRSAGAFIAVGLLSMVLNLLMLTSPIFMLQVYDRVLTSGSVPTLLALCGLALCLFFVSGVIDLVRARILVRIGLALDDRIAAGVFDTSTRQVLGERPTANGAIRELEILRNFLSGPGPAALFDLPWAPLYLGLLAIFHWMLGLVAVVGTLLLLILAQLTETLTRRSTPRVMETNRQAQELANAGYRNAGVLMAMGLRTHYRERWLNASRNANLTHSRLSDRLAYLQATSKALRLALQSAILAVGAYLAIQGEITAGTIVAASILLGRGLAPFEQAISHWKSFSRARAAYRELQAMFAASPLDDKRTALPPPKGLLEVRDLRAATPNGERLVLKGVSFAVAPGQVVAVIGPSAAGKSTLVKCIARVQPWLAGEIRLDGARIDHWDPDALGRHVGYVPQESELFAGTVRDNISRFDPAATDEGVTAAAMLARAHDLILNLPSGYETEVGPDARHLSAGQKQRIALARALFGNPALIVLDEPNSNLDSFGEAALMKAIAELKRQERTILIVSHRAAAVGSADLILAIEDGVQRAFGPRDEVMGKLERIFQSRSDDGEAGKTAEEAAASGARVAPLRSVGL